MDGDVASLHLYKFKPFFGKSFFGLVVTIIFVQDSAATNASLQSASVKQDCIFSLGSLSPLVPALE